MKRFSAFAFLLLLTLLAASPVFAQEGAAAAGGGHHWVVITAGFAMAIASSGCALAQGKAIAAACEGLARNPGAAPAIRFALLLGLVLIESLALYTLLIVFLKVG
ncbi:MAG: ATP synthase F0 subunit C [Acidobacteria bacterium]|nr:ATP synthase F0 subunit C [Acidobacteriota bacterium]MCI0628594.1 ATP synthase F0 subunit C [Acidobacteriota bacterium]MCI0719153.1 ATP synthase F0 subunit C [Acidobacteriota bacterium]